MVDIVCVSRISYTMFQSLNRCLDRTQCIYNNRVGHRAQNLEPLQSWVIEASRSINRLNIGKPALI